MAGKELILGVNTLYRLFCFFKLFPMVGKGLNTAMKLCSWWYSRLLQFPRYILYISKDHGY